MRPASNTSEKGSAFRPLGGSDKQRHLYENVAVVSPGEYRVESARVRQSGSTGARLESSSIEFLSQITNPLSSSFLEEFMARIQQMQVRLLSIQIAHK